MRATAGKWLGTILMIVLLILVTGYLTLSLYYMNRFPYGTWINQIYCTGKSVEQVGDILSQQNEYKGITVTDKKGDTFIIRASDIGLRADYMTTLQKDMDMQNPFAWGIHLMKGSYRNITADYFFDTDQLNRIISKWPLWDKSDSDRTVTIVSTQNGYQLQNQMTDIPVKSSIMEAVRNAIASGKKELNLADIAGCYQDQKLTESMQSVCNTYSKIAKLQSFNMTYLFGTQKKDIDAAAISGWFVTQPELEKVRKEKKQKSNPGSSLFIAAGKEIPFPEDYRIENGFVTDAQGQLLISEAAMYSFLQEMFGQYDTIGSTRQFQATSGRNITVAGGTYGNEIDLAEEYSYLKNAFMSGKSGQRIPQYIAQALEQGTDDIGGTYIEVDMKDQKLYYYENRKLLVTMPVVTGSVKMHRQTPEGVYYVYSKKRDKVLRGQGYASFVHYWMAVYKGVGIHDASWRDEFGGEIYETGGSHGCINGPGEQISKLYGMVKTGTPVILFD